MSYKIEDALEILAGLRPRIVNIRIDASERNLISSIAKQVHKSVPLTDRQLNLVLKKIDKYRDGLLKNSVDVDDLILNKPLRMSLRDIDRSQSVTLDYSQGGIKPRILVKYVFSKKFAAEWGELEENLIGVSSEVRGFKHVSYNEKNLYHIVAKLSSMDFVIDQEIQEIYEKIVKIMENPEKIVPYLDVDNHQVRAVNVNKICNDFLSEKFPTVTEDNFPEFVAMAKNCGILLKSPEILRKIQNLPLTALTKSILTEKSTKFRVDPKLHDLHSLFTAVNNLRQWPLLIVLDENFQVFDQVKTLVGELTHFTDLAKVNVFFRLKNEQPDDKQFNQFIRDNGLNNYIDSTTQAVFITKNRIPKPLLKSEWQPSTAIVFTSNDYGKLAAYLNDIPNVYYYNESLSLRHSRVRGSKEIAQL